MARKVITIGKSPTYAQIVAHNRRYSAQHLRNRKQARIAFVLCTISLLILSTMLGLVIVNDLEANRDARIYGEIRK